MTKKQIITFITVVCISVVAVLLLAASQTPRSAANTNTSTSTAQYARGQLAFTQRIAGSADKLAVDLAVINVDANAPILTTTELVIRFDPVQLTADSIDIPEGLLYLNKKIDNAAGKISVDIAKPGGINFTSSELVSTIVFTKKTGYEEGNAVVGLEAGSTLGIPDVLSESLSATKINL